MLPEYSTIEKIEAARFVYKKKISEGGFARVYEVFDTVSHKNVALKIVRMIYI